MNKKLILNTIGRYLNYELCWTKNTGHGTNNDGSDILLWVRDHNVKDHVKLPNWNPFINSEDCFKLCLEFNITLEVDKKLGIVTAGYISPLGNPSNLRDYINRKCQKSSENSSEELLKCARYLTTMATFEICKAHLFNKVNISESELECLLNDTTD